MPKERAAAILEQNTINRDHIIANVIRHVQIGNIDHEFRARHITVGHFGDLGFQTLLDLSVASAQLILHIIGQFPGLDRGGVKTVEYGLGIIIKEFIAGRELPVGNRIRSQ